MKVRDVIETILSGEIIEYYSSDYPCPNCLISGKCREEKDLYIVCSLVEGNIWMITTYYPDINEWLEDFKTGRR